VVDQRDRGVAHRSEVLPVGLQAVRQPEAGCVEGDAPVPGLAITSRQTIDHCGAFRNSSGRPVPTSV
jgi:hypothetical protein